LWGEGSKEEVSKLGINRRREKRFPHWKKKKRDNEKMKKKRGEYRRERGRSACSKSALENTEKSTRDRGQRKKKKYKRKKGPKFHLQRCKKRWERTPVREGEMNSGGKRLRGGDSQKGAHSNFV